MANEEDGLERALLRLSRMMLALAAGGAIAAGAWRGWTWAAGFALGAAVAWLSFRWLKKTVYALGSNRPGRTRMVVLAGLRYLLLGGGAYVILHFSRISLPAALGGLFVPAGAVIIEIIVQLAYAGT